ncbi:hypothetical protein B0A53_02603 [Rhodotorula sp. CCFEE 5036]|nr:hypothetical protein B0A53_02603 [Rhodotorula sp. CCFEE 5036]
MAFKRPFHAQSRTPVRSSDLRRLRDALASQFTALADQPDALKRLTADLQVCKATTHLDEPCTLYTAPNGDPRFFKLEDQAPPLLVPTCYATDLVPAGTLLPVLGTAEPVVQNLISGSALFAAGVSPSHLAHLAAQTSPPVRAGDLVGITVASDPTQRIVAVGYLAADPKDIQQLQEQDKGGRAVLTLHARGDFLWQSGSKVDAPLPEPQVRKADNGGGNDALADRLAATSLSRSPSSASSSAASTSAPAPAEPSRKQKKGKDKKERHGGKNGLVPVDAEEEEQPAADETRESVTAAAAAELTPAEIDTILINALLLAISTSPALQKPATFPLSASSLYSSYILPSRPASPPSHATVEIKKSSFKKLDRFVKQAVKKGYLAAKELKKGTGEWIVTSVEGRHPDAEKVPRYKTVAEAAAAAGGNDLSTASTSATTAAGETSTSSAGAAAATAGAGGAGAGGVQVRELWKLSGDGVKELFRSVPHERPPHDLYTTADLSSLLRKYTDSHALSHPSHRSLLLIHPSASPTPDKLSPEQQAGIALLARKGSPPTIKVAIKNVGKRQVTLISGHEPWDLFTSEELAEKLKHASASSTSIQPLAGSAKKGQTPKVEIMCQGTHDALVTKLLTAYGVPKSYIEVDLSKSKK